MAAVIQRIANIKDNLQEDNNTALVTGADTDIKNLAKQMTKIEQNLTYNKQQSKNLSSVLSIIISYTRRISSGCRWYEGNDFLNEEGVLNLVPDHIGLSSNCYFQPFVL